MTRPPVVCLMGPTASGKTGFALRLADEFPFDLISVDSALVYRGMDIGTAKPDPDTLKRYPHALIDIRDPEVSYSAGEFARDAILEIERSFAAGRLPLLVGGTMLYFRALIEGIAELPGADPAVRAAIDAEAAEQGWPALHALLAEVDPPAAARMSPNDSQRIQRALEVYRLSGRPLSDWQATAAPSEPGHRFAKIALAIEPRAELHRRIAERWQAMLAAGFVEEVRGLRSRSGLRATHSSMRAVGYRQIWAHLDGEDSLETAGDKALAATRQLAKRQLTWLRGDSDVAAVDALDSGAFDTISDIVRGCLASC